MPPRLECGGVCVSEGPTPGCAHWDSCSDTTHPCPWLVLGFVWTENSTFGPML